MLMVDDAAALAGISASFLNKMRYQGGGPRYVKIGRSVRYDSRDMEAWMEARKVGSNTGEVGK